MNADVQASAGESDPRVFFSAERTLLSWLRTGITLMAFGFVIARFGLLLDLLAQQKVTTTAREYPTFSAIIGVLLMIGGAFATLGATIQHHRFVKTLGASQLPQDYSISFALLTGWILSVLGLVLAVYLAVAEFLP